MQDFKKSKNIKTKQNRRKRKKEPRNWRKLLLKVLHLCLFAGGMGMVCVGSVLAVQLLFDSDYFHIEKIEVVNKGRVSREEILGLADINLGTRIFDFDPKMVGAKIEENPWIASAEVERVLPRTLVVRVTERTPVAIINPGYLYYVDEEGEIFKRLTRGDDLDYPVITGINRKYLLDKPEEAKRRIVESVKLVKELGERKKFGLAQVSELNIHKTDGLILYTNDGGVPIRMGKDGFSEKLGRLESVYTKLKSRLETLKSIDLNLKDKVIVRLEDQIVSSGADV